MKYTTKELGLIFVEAVNGSQQHSKEFVEEITPYIRKIVFSNRVNATDVDDIIQDVFFRLFSHGKSFDPEKGTITGWASAITGRTLVDRYRREKKRKEDVPFIGEEGFVRKNSRMEESERAFFLFSIFSPTMSERERDFVKLHFFEGYSYEECSKAMDIPSGTLKSAVSRMYNRFRDVVKEEKGVLVS